MTSAELASPYPKTITLKSEGEKKELNLEKRNEEEGEKGEEDEKEEEKDDEVEKIKTEQQP